MLVLEAKVFQSANVRGGNVRDVYVIADAGPVAGRVVVAKDGDGLPAPHGHLNKEDR